MPTAQVPEPVVVPPFERTGLNDDIWADVHKAMAEVAEVLNSVNKNKSEEQASSSNVKRQTGVGRWEIIDSDAIVGLWVNFVIMQCCSI